MADLLAELNPTQREAVEAVGGPVLILAGPGSGKTRVIAHRVAYLIKVCGVSPRHIMAVTFTNKAARELGERLRGLASAALEDLTVGTFHAICARILRRKGRAIGIDPSFVIYDDSDQISLLKRAIVEAGLDPKQYSASAISSAISAAKSRLITPQAYLESKQSYFEGVVGRVYERYQEMLRLSNALDFDDLLMETVHLFRQHPDVLDRYQTRYQHVMVDEFQDTNLVQYEIIKLIAAKYRNACVVGDPDQSIYSWRFADLRNILSFEKDYPEAKVVLLERNYRSTQTILEAATGIISANRQRKPIKLWTEKEPGELVTVVETYSQQEEARFVTSEVEKMVERGKASLADCAVMYRTNAQSRALEEAFIRYGMPYKLVAGTRFYERREVKDVIAHLRLIQNPDDRVSLLRVINVPPRGLGQKSLAELAGWVGAKGLSLYQALGLLDSTTDDKPALTPRAHKSMEVFHDLIEGLIARSRELDLVDLFDQVIERTGYKDYLTSGPEGEERWENILELRTVAEQYRHLPAEEGLTAFLEAVALVSDVDSLDDSVDAVTLITLHKAKGLEYPVVFIVGAEEGVLPHFRSFDDPDQMEEERRLCYVGVTRAKDRLYLVRAYRRNLMGGSNVNEPSRFIKDIPPHLICGGELWSGEESQAASRLYSWDTDAEPVLTIPELKAGDRVRHDQFGDGVVIGYQALKDDAEVVVDFKWTGTKKLLLSFARLEKAA
jgi:DNA helicase-2/ATP-dependent DNA helicase PcrA